jgi:hypothetical protein
MSARRTVAAWLAVFALALGGAGVAPAQQPSPEELWEMYPLDPTGRGEREQPATTTATTSTTTTAVAPPPSPQPQSGVAGTVTTSRDRSASADESDEDASVSLALVLGGLAAAIVLLAAAVVPAAVAPRLGAFLADYRLEVALAGAVTLLVVAVVYVSVVT